MARKSQTDVAILGVLSVQPLTGYGVRKAINEVLGHFWHESFGQVYPALANLTKRGLVRPMNDTYAITAAGRRALAVHLREPSDVQKPRNGVLLRLFFGASLDAKAIAQLLDESEARAREQIATLAGVREALASEPLARVHGGYWLSTISAGEHQAKATLAWVAETRQRLLSKKKSVTARHPKC